MLNVFYYYYYLFYTKVLPDDQPHSTVVFTLSFSLSLIVNGILSIITAYAGYNLSNYIMVGVFVVILIVNYLIFYRTGKGKQLVTEKPKFYANHKLSVFFTLCFFIITSSYLFWGPVLTKELLSK